MCYRDGNDCRRCALFCISRQDEILGHQDYGNTRSLITPVWLQSHAARAFSDLYREKVVSMYHLSDYDYDLPETFIAQHPQKPRDHSRLLLLDRKKNQISHHRFYEIYDLLDDADILVVNNTEVIPARLVGKKETGGRAEVLILNNAGWPQSKTSAIGMVCDCLVRASKRPKAGTRIRFDQGLKGEIIECRNDIFRIRFTCRGDFEDTLYQIGKVPLPPYIKRSENEITVNDRTSYQTVYASQKGAIAAPTAGLHFTEALFDKIETKGVKIAPVTLHVGYGTFLPIRSKDIRRHRMQAEWFSISQTAADLINQSKKDGNRIIAVGTTCVRALESVSDDQGAVAAGSGSCDLFIFPGYRFKVIDAMITNFHLPKSTLMMLASAFAGRENILNAYREAIEQKYRFYSYGDAMMIL